MDDIRVEQAKPESAFAAAALHLQCDIAAGFRPAPGFLDQFVDWWLPRRADHPLWLALAPTGDPVGVCSAAREPARPRPGVPAGQRLRVDALFVPAPWRRRGIGSRLLVEVQSWSRTHGMREVTFPSSADRAFLEHRGAGEAAGGGLEWRAGSAPKLRV